MWKKRMLMLSLAVLCLSGCGNKGETAKEKIKKDDNVFTIVMNEEDKVSLDNVKEMIEEKYGMKTEVKAVSEEKKREMMLNGKADLALVSGEELGFAADEKLIQEVKIKKDTYLPASVVASQYNGKQYGIPGKFDVPIFVYNPSVIKGEVKTLEQLKAFTKKEEIAKNETNKTEKNATDNSVYGFYTSLFRYEYVDAILKANGFQLYGEKNTSMASNNLKITGEKAEQGLLTMKDWSKTLILNEDLSRKEMITSFDEKKFYSFLAYPEDVKEITIPYEVQTIPAMKENMPYQPMLQAKSWVVMKNVNKKDMIQDIISYLSNEETVKKQIESENFFTPIRIKWDDKEKSVAKTVYQQAENSYSYPVFAEMKEVQNPMIREIQHFINDKIDEKTALKNAKQSISYQISSNYEK